MPSAVKCMVQQCVYNAGLHCSADAIMIKSFGNDTVGTSRGTLCDTFSYKSNHMPDHS